MKKIGEILIENGSLTRDQLNVALKQQKKEPNKLLGQVLIELGYITEDDIVVALAIQFNIPYLPISNFTLNEAVETLISKELIQKYMCVPLERIGNLITVVMADPTNEQAIREIEAATKCKVQAFVATATEIKSVIEQHFHINVSAIPGLKGNASEVSFRSAVTKKTESKPTP